MAGVSHVTTPGEGDLEEGHRILIVELTESPGPIATKLAMTPGRATEAGHAAA